ncbi:MAG TPA: LLM class flavin-dependent oxidoreductase [Candidatus Nitrosopolaris sp.]|nr:LLM class flavin-dependent oxidoreductase [Candidatus Nitrosopolaris sp.]
MKIGLGLPNADKSLANGRLLVDIAHRADSLGFSTLATIGRVAFPNYEELISLAAAAAVTEKIGLFTDILLAATREPVLLAKQAATLDQVSGGRFVLGIGTGSRPDDFAITGTDFHTRGRRIDAALELMHRAWRGEPLPGTEQPLTPRLLSGDGVPIMFGGGAEPVIRRVVKYGIGWTQGGGTPESLTAMMERINAAWKAARRAGKPKFRALAYFVIGDELHEEAESNLVSYYGEFGSRVWRGTVKSADEAKERVNAYEAVGADELILFIAAPHLDQVDRLAAAVL